MATVDLWVKPYMIRQAILHNSDQMTLEELRDAIGVNVNSVLTFTCPQCAWIDPDSQPNPLPGEGLIVNPDNPAEKIECPTCGGWGAIETPVPVTQTFGKVDPPTVLQP